jgi:hypothetical protein
MALWFGIPLQKQDDVPCTHNAANRISGKDSWAYLRTAQLTNRPSHADQLHVDLWWRGMNIAQDAGTYRYTADPPWDNGLTTGLVHNTVTVDDRDQFTRAGRFLYLDWFNAFQSACPESDPAILHCVRGWHAGYRKEGIRHARTVTAFTDGHWQIQDDLQGLRNPRRRQATGFRLHWLLPDWEWWLEAGPAGMLLRLASPHGPVELRIGMTPGTATGVDLARAGLLIFQSGPVNRIPPVDTAIRGWVSPTYGLKVPALSLVVETKSANDVKFVSEFNFPP